MRFTKMQGIGNDYVYVDCFNDTLPMPAEQLSPIVSDRRFGIGGDGLILILPSERADARMRMYNADGSESEMCGNGIRCVAKYVYDHGLSHKNPLLIETGRGELSVQLHLQENKVHRVTVDMGQPILEAEKIPVNLPHSTVVDVTVAWSQPELAKLRDSPMTCVSMGNPHVIFYTDDVHAIPLEKYGPLLEHADIFPRRINVHFVQVHSPGELTMRTWERGSGITWACGTGACAVCVAGVLTGRSATKIVAHLPGGDLELEWPGA